MNIKAALDYHEQHRKENEPRLLKGDIGKELFKDSKPATVPVVTTRLFSGETKRFKTEWVKTICDMTGVDANFLFGIKPMKGAKNED